MDWTFWVVAVAVVVAALAIRFYLGRGATISQAQLLEWMEQGADVYILDVRSAPEYDSGHVPGAVNISHTELAANLDEVKPHRDKNVVVYCERGVRARMAQQILTKSGFANVYHLTGDMAAWRNASMPTEKADTAAK